MKILISGSSGFIGTHLVEKYVQLGYKVVAVDRVAPTKINPLVYYYTADLLNVSDTFLSTLLMDVEVVNHHAAQIDVRKSIEDPFLDAEQNILVTLRLLQACVKAKVKYFIYASSGGAIAGSEQPSSPYGIAKLTCEKYIAFFREHHGLKTSSLRYSNVYGPGQVNGVIPIFIKKMLNNEDVVVNGGSQTRDFIYVEDVCLANIEALNLMKWNWQFYGFNVSSGVNISISDLASQLKLLCNSTSNIIAHPLIKGEVLDGTLLPLFPTICYKTSLNEGLKLTIESFR